MGKKRKPQNNFTTMRVSKDFVDKVTNNRIAESAEDTLRRLLGWEPLKKKIPEALDNTP